MRAVGWLMVVVVLAVAAAAVWDTTHEPAAVTDCRSRGGVPAFTEDGRFGDCLWMNSDWSRSEEGGD